MGLVSESGCQVGDSVVGMLPCYCTVKGKLILTHKPPERYIVRRLYREGGAVVARPSDPHRGWHIDIGGVIIFRPEHSPDIYVGAEHFKDFAVKEG